MTVLRWPLQASWALLSADHCSTGSVFRIVQHLVSHLQIWTQPLSNCVASGKGLNLPGPFSFVSWKDSYLPAWVSRRSI